MQVKIDPQTRQILSYGLAGLDNDPDLIDVDDKAFPLMLQPGVKTLQPDGSISVVAPSPAQLQTVAPTAPNIAGIVNALIASASIDQSTKSALIAALKGQ